MAIYSAIFAMDRNRVIGANNAIPWKLPAELAYFKQTTMGHPIVMGRKTYESIGRPLPGRENIVITRDLNFKASGCVVLHSTEELLKRFESSEQEVFVIGGAVLFQDMLPYLKRVYLTVIESEFKGDTYLPVFEDDHWVAISETPGRTDEANPYGYKYLIYETKGSSGITASPVP